VREKERETEKKRKKEKQREREKEKKKEKGKKKRNETEKNKQIFHIVFPKEKIFSCLKILWIILFERITLLPFHHFSCNISSKTKKGRKKRKG
jgi:hypothetical protein